MIQQYDIHFERNSPEHKVLSLLRYENLTTAQVIKQMGKSQKNAANLRMQIGELARKGYVKSVGHDHWQLTERGMDAVLIFGGDPTPRLRNLKTKLTTGTMSGTYDGKELGHTCLRPGAYDFTGLPSLIAGQRKWWRREIIAMENHY